MGNLRKENQHPEGINKPGHHGLRNKSHQARHTENAKQNLNDPGQDHGRQNVLHAMLSHHRADD
ncbi:hypothetical protein D3C72_2172820 [compost metagenome]